MRATIEVADIFRAAGPGYRLAHAGHLSLGQLKVMSAIETCRTAALGGHVEACTDCGHQRIAYNSCRNRHNGLLAGSARKDCIAQARALLAVAPPPEEPPGEEPADQRPPCPCCGGTMVIIETFARGCRPRAPPAARQPNRETIHDPA